MTPSITAKDVILEKNCRVSLNMNKFMTDKSRTHNLSNSCVYKPSLDRQQKTFSKPDHLVQKLDDQKVDNRLVLSQFSGWLTVDESK